jgi:enamine deaminase RidA (YjgF/YER057c/UK114 family)
MVKEVIIMPNTDEHPFSSAVRAGDYIFLSGSGGFVDKDGREMLIRVAGGDESALFCDKKGAEEKCLMQ